MLLSILSLVLQIVFFAILNTDLYTDRARMPDGRVRVWHRSPISRLHISDQTGFLYLYLFLAAVCILTGILILFGVKQRAVRTIRLAALIGSAAVFILIMILTSDAFVSYSY